MGRNKLLNNINNIGAASLRFKAVVTSILNASLPFFSLPFFSLVGSLTCPVA
jgi:hypothetical protein